MESTGVDWKPVWNILEEQFAVVLVTAQQSKAVPGRKTDTKDCQWIADVLQHGWLQGSFVPPTPIRQRRDLTRLRTNLRRDHTAVANRMQKILEDANLKLAAVARDWLGASGRAMLGQLLAGEADSAQLADLARGRLREEIPALPRALAGRFTDRHRWLVRLQWEQLKFLEAHSMLLDAKIQEGGQSLRAGHYLMHHDPWY